MNEMENLAIAVIFGILLICIWTALRRSALFNGTSTICISLCVTALCIIAMFGLPGSPKSEPHHAVLPSVSDMPAPSFETGLDLQGLLLPYAALGFSMLAILLLMLLKGVWNLKVPKDKRSPRPSDRLIPEQSIRPKSNVDLPELKTPKKKSDREANR